MSHNNSPRPETGSSDSETVPLPIDQRQVSITVSDPNSPLPAPESDMETTPRQAKSSRAIAMAGAVLERPLSFGRRLKNFANRCFHLVKSEVGLVILLVVYTWIGAAAFVAIEGKAEDDAIEAKKAGRDAEMEEAQVRKRLVIDAILNTTLCDRTDTDAGERLEAILSNYELQSVSNFQQQVNKTAAPEKQWTYAAAFFYCGTVFTTVGYGNIVPVTDTGRIVTMVYAAVGIPLCLVVLTKLGRLLTRAIKFLWSFVRRFYYTGSCFRIRRIGWRKLSVMEKFRLRFRLRNRSRRTKNQLDDIYLPYDVDDNFNLPPVVALLIAFLYFLLGVLIYTRWENWDFLEAFYFCFTSLATIGFGDVIPNHPVFFLASAAYLLVGLSLVAMVINVIMEAVSETIVKATDRVKLVRDRVKEVKERIIGKPGGRKADQPVLSPPASAQTVSLLRWTPISSNRRRSI